ncbi:MAG: nucleoside hydrolase [Spirochaetota bacterium]
MFENTYKDRFTMLSGSYMLERLSTPMEKVDVVLDTDTYNEVDDQFALAYSLLVPERINVEAVYAAPFLNDRAASPADGMVKSYNEIQTVLGLMGRKESMPVLKGSDRFLENPADPVRSPAALDLVERAMRRKEKPLYVLAIGCPVNIASALLIEPAIREKIIVVWLGSHPPYWMSAREFNCSQDIISSQVLYNSGVPFVNIPCKNVAEHLRTSVPELKACIAGTSRISDYLYSIVKDYSKGDPVWSKVIWDISTVAYLVNPSWIPTQIIHAPVLTDHHTFSLDARRHFMRVAIDANRDLVFADMFARLNACGN